MGRVGVAAITRHIPEKGFQLVRYVGWYSNRIQGDRRKKLEEERQERENEPLTDEIEIIDVSAYRTRKILPLVWRECIKKIWEVDPLTCPHCQGEMKIISFIAEQAVI
jgi:hypothetical protein